MKGMVQASRQSNRSGSKPFEPFERHARRTVGAVPQTRLLSCNSAIGYRSDSSGYEIDPTRTRPSPSSPGPAAVALAGRIIGLPRVQRALTCMFLKRTIAPSLAPWNLPSAEVPM